MPLSLLRSFRPAPEEAETLLRPTLISLGAGAFQAPVLDAARRAGYDPIAVDRNPGAPGFRSAALQVHRSILSARRIAEQVGEGFPGRSVEGVLARTYGAGVVSAAILARRLQLPGPDPRALRYFRNKRRVKESLAAAGFGAPPSYAWDTAEARRRFQDESGPLLARPARGHAKLHMQILRTRKERLAFLRDRSPDTGAYLVEPLIESRRELTVMAFALGGRAHIALVTEKIVSSAPPLFAELAHVFPAQTAPEQLQAIQATLDHLVAASGLDRSPLVAEFLLPVDPETGADSADAPLLVECMPETGGERLAELIVPAAFGADYFDQLVNLAAHGTVDLTRFARPRQSVVIRYLLQREGELVDFAFPETRAPGLLAQERLAPPGTRTSLARANLDRLAYFALAGELDRRDELLARAEAYAAQFVIEYREGDSV